MGKGKRLRNLRKQNEVVGNSGIIPPHILEKIKEGKAHKANKGLFEGACNREACQAPGATYYNFSTRQYYCKWCASEINKYSEGSLDHPGEPLCVSVENKFHPHNFKSE